MAKRSRKGCFRCLFLIFLLLLIVCILLEQNFSQTMLDMAYAQAYATALESINMGAYQALSSGVTYEDLVETVIDVEGRVSMLRTNTIRMNQIASDAASAIQVLLNQSENKTLMIPLGSVLGIRALAAMGPSIPVDIIPIGAVSTHFETEFEDAGINQTRHKVYLTLRAVLHLIIPTGSRMVDVSTSIPVAESLIVGQVPESFVDVNDEMDMLDFIP